MHRVVNEILVAHGLSAESFTPSRHRPRVTSGIVPGDEVVRLWAALRERFADTKVWPVIRGDEFDDADDDHVIPTDPQPRGSVRELLAGRFAEQREVLAELVPGLADLTDFDAAAAAVDRAGVNSFRGAAEPEVEWPTEAPDSAGEDLAFHSTTDFQTGRPYPTVTISLVETDHPHDVPVHLGFGGWNDAPHPELQAAVLREWGKAYGAVPACVTRDVLECFVERPPQTESAAMRLAAEQWLFCDDIVSQGTQTVRRLAVEIWRSPRWFFWWD
jgi:hypothetical protein